MIGGVAGFITALVCVACGDNVSYWWLLWGTLIGLVFELLARVGGGEALGEAVGSAFDVTDALGSFDSSDSGGDCGGGGD